MLAGLISHACAQSSPNLSKGQVPTAGQWNSYFSAKQDVLNFPPLNKNGDAMLGRLAIAPPTTGAFLSRFNVGPGIVPSAPADGDIWTTPDGLYVQIAGATVGPLMSTAALAGAAPITVTGTTVGISTNSNAFSTVSSQLALATGGVAYGSPTGGQLGAGIFNAKGYYVDNVKVPTISSTDTLTNKTWNGVAVDVAHGGTGAVTAPAALENLGAAPVSWPANYLANGDFSVWTLCPLMNCTVQIVDGTLGTTTGFPTTPVGIINLWPNSWNLGAGYGGTVTFSLQNFTDNQTTVPGYPQRFARGTWTVAPTLGSYTENPPSGTCSSPGGATLTGCRNTYLDSGVVREYTSFGAGNTYTVSGWFRASTTSVFVAPILYYSLGYNDWVLGQDAQLVGGYANHTATNGQYYVYQATSSGLTGRTVTGVANNGSGLCRITVDSTANYTTGRTAVVASLGGTTTCNGTYTITVIDGTHIDLQSSSFSGTFTSGGAIGMPPTTATIGATQNDGNVTWQNKGYAKGRSYDLYEGSYTPGAVTSSGYNQGQVANGSTGCTITTSWTFCKVTIVLPPPEYNNLGDYAWSVEDPTRQLLPWNLTNLYFGGSNNAVLQFGVDIVGPLGAQSIDYAQIQVEPGTQATVFHKVPHRLQRLWSMNLEDLLGYMPLSPSQKTGFLTQTRYNDVGNSATFARRVIATAISGTSIANQDGVSGDPTLQGTVGIPGGGTGYTVAPATAKGGPASPTGSASATLVMAGIGSSATITPTTTGFLDITFQGYFTSDTVGSGCQFNIRTGTGTAPANGAAATGTTQSSANSLGTVTVANTHQVPFTIRAIGSATAGVANWMDLAFRIVNAGTCTLASVSWTAVELR